jgi:hypothetical protein
LYHAASRSCAAPPAASHPRQRRARAAAWAGRVWILHTLRLLQASPGASLQHVRVLCHGNGSSLPVSKQQSHLQSWAQFWWAIGGQSVAQLGTLGHAPAMEFPSVCLYQQIGICLSLSDHCRYVNNCVGSATLRHFILFLSSLVMGVAYGLGLGLMMGWKDRAVLWRHTSNVLLVSRGRTGFAVDCVGEHNALQGMLVLACLQATSHMQPLLRLVTFSVRWLFGAPHWVACWAYFTFGELAMRLAALVSWYRLCAASCAGSLAPLALASAVQPCPPLCDCSVLGHFAECWSLAVSPSASAAAGRELPRHLAVPATAARAGSGSASRSVGSSVVSRGRHIQACH